MTTYNRYVTAFIGFIMMFFVGTFFAWSLFRIALAEYFSTWTASDYSLNFTIFTMCFCSGGLLGGKLIGIWNRQRALWLSAATVLLGGILFSSIPSMAPSIALVVVYLSYGMLCGLGGGIAYNVIISGISMLFSVRSSLVSGILLTGFGFGSLFLGSLIEKAALRFGFFPVFRTTAILIALILFLGSSRLRSPASTAVPVDAVLSFEHGYTPSQMLKTPAFWFYLIWVIFTNTSGLLVINNAATIAVYFGSIGTLGMIVSLFNGFSRIGIGMFFGRFGSRPSVLLNTSCALAAGALLLTAALTNQMCLMFAGIIIAGITYGFTIALNATVIKDLFGPKYFSMNFSIVSLSGIPASILGPYISGVLQDRSNGAYTTTFIAMCIFALISLLFCLLLCRAISSLKSD